MLALTACAGPNPGAQQGRVSGSDVVTELQGRGVSLIYVGSQVDGSVGHSAEVYRVGRDQVRVYEYPSPAQAGRDATRLSFQGSLYDVYQRRNVLVVHIGTDPGVSSVLTQAFGAPRR